MNQWHVHHSTVGFSTCSTIALTPGSTMAFTMKNVIILLWFTMKVIAALTLLTMLNLTSASATEIVQYTVWNSPMTGLEWTWNQNLFVTVRSFNFPKMDFFWFFNLFDFCPNNWISDGFCNEECNHPNFHYDGGDCCFDIVNINVLFTDLWFLLIWQYYPELASF